MSWASFSCVSADKFHFYLFIFCALVLSSIANGTSFGIYVCVSYGKWCIWKSVILCLVNRYHSHEIFLQNVCRLKCARYFDSILYFPRNFSTEKGEQNPFKNNRPFHAELPYSVLSLSLSNLFDIVNLHTMNWDTMLLLLQGRKNVGGWFHIRLKISLTGNLMRHKNQIYCIIRLMTCFHSLDWTFNCSWCVSFGSNWERVSIFRQYFHKAHTHTHNNINTQHTHSNQSIGVEKRFFFQLIFRFSCLILATVLSHCHFTL